LVGPRRWRCVPTARQRDGGGPDAMVLEVGLEVGDGKEITETRKPSVVNDRGLLLLIRWSRSTLAG
jgi:hypothetical protein